MKHDHKTLHTVGEALYGASWQSDLARSLGVSIRTMQRWAAGQFEIPDNVWSDIAALCAHRAAQLLAISKKLRA